jgi:ABC-type glycerol-3-phosphate transport system permease component
MSPAMTTSHQAVQRRKEWCKHLILAFVLFFSFVPFVMMVAISFKTNDQFVQNPWFFDNPAHWQWQNWVVGWATVKNYIANSIVVAIGAVILTLCIALPTSYVVARYRFPGREVVYYAFMMTMFLPGGAAALVTTFNLISNMGLVNNLLALVLLSGFGGQVGAIFILRQFIEEIPKELFESADMDGAGHLRQMVFIMLPLAAPIIGTVAITNFLHAWNDLILPLILLRDNDLLTIPVGLMRLDGEYVKLWGPMMAAFTIASIPLVVLFLFTTRFFVRGLTAGAVKG